MVPPYRDPELRRAFALDAPDQCALLMRMAGFEPLTPVSKLPSFTPLPGTVRRSAQLLAYTAAARPESTTLDDESAELRFLINHDGLDSRPRIRTKDGIARLAGEIARYEPRVGIWSMPFLRPRDWTARTIREVIGLIAGCLPEAPGDDLELRAHLLRQKPGENFVRLWVSRTPSEDQRRKLWMEDFSYTGWVFLQPGAASKAVKEWYRLLNREFGTSHYTGGTLEHIDTHFETDSRRRRRRHCDDDDLDFDDDDLDFIERAARKALHGSDNAPANIEDEASSIEAQLKETGAQIAALQKRLQDLLDNQ